MFNEARLVHSSPRGGKKETVFKGFACDEPEFEIRPERIKTGKGELIFLYLKALKPLRLADFIIEARPLDVDDDSLMMVNGFQSWSSSREMGRNDCIKPVNMLSRFATGPYGDYGIHTYTGRRGRLHSWTYTHFRNTMRPFYMLGSVDESPGYTLFDYDYDTGCLIIRRDCEGVFLNIGESYSLLSLYTGKGPERELYDEYFARWSLRRKDAPHCTGWTSWYNYYTGISEDIVDDNLEALRKESIPIDVFQIDDGYQEAVGDWLRVNEKFPSGMGTVAAKIRNYGYKPGLWLAPFICEQNSKLIKSNPDWLLRDKEGKPVRAGWNPLWSGFFYALDFYADGFREYLREVFNTVTREWGFELLKLDFLYAAAILPRKGRSRGQVMSEAMDFIDDIAGKTRLLGCGVPLGPATGKVDYCRIGSDVGPFWEFRFLKQLNVRERISTVSSLHSTIARHRLDGKAFRNDPDVFILRDGTPRVNHNKLNNRQRHTLFFINHLLGGLVFFSDNVEEYSPEQLNLLRRAYPVCEKEIVEIKPEGDLYKISFKVNGSEYLALVNMGSRPFSTRVKKDLFFNPELFIVKGVASFLLQPYESVCFRKVKPREEKPYFLGSSGHIYPGAQVEKVIVREDNVILKLARGASDETRVFFAVPPGVSFLRVNGRDYPVSEHEGFRYVAVKPEIEEDMVFPDEKTGKSKQKLPEPLPYKKPGRPKGRIKAKKSKER